MTVEELNRYVEIGKLPVVIYCEKRYEGICCMLKLIKDNKVFLDFDDTYDDGASEGAFRATFKFDSFDRLIQAVEQYTDTKLSELTINPYCYEKFECTEPQWSAFQWDLYHGKIAMLQDYSDFYIGDFWWKGLFLRKIRPDCSREELSSWIKQANSDLLWKGKQNEEK